MEFFDASKVAPSQGVGGHPPGRFPFQITNSYAKENNAKTGAMLVVELTSDVGRIENRYNIWNASAQAVEIAQKELSALCHAVNIFRITFPRDAQNNYDMGNAARELRGGRGVMEVAPQTDKEGKPNGYMEVKKVFDSQGNEPGKQGSAPQVQPAQQQPAQQPSTMPAQAPMTAQGGSWGGGAPQGAANPPPAQQAGGWSPGGQPNAAPASPPWGK